MISTNCWAPRGFASEFPEKYELDDEEIERINAMAKLQLDDAKQELEEAEKETGEKAAVNKLQNQVEIDDDLKEYDFENYDNEGEAAEGNNVTFMPGLSNSEATFVEEEGDGFLTLPTEVDQQEEKQELQIYPTDNIILSGRTEDEVSYLDVYIYDDGAGAPDGASDDEFDALDPDVKHGMVRESNLYVHHDMMLPSFPLCTEWLSFKPNGSNSADNVGNFAAVGTFDPQIEIWNLDCIDKAFPDAILGEPVDIGGKKKKKKAKKNAHVLTHHTDAIFSLSHNKVNRVILASSSADKTVKLWDLTTCTAARSFKSIHREKQVSSIQWHPNVSLSGADSILLSGGYDGSVCVSDVRIAEEKNLSKRWLVNPGEEVENVRWGGLANDNIFYAGTDTGTVYGYDVRKEGEALWKLQAHDSGITSLDSNSFLDGLLVTSGMGDKLVKIWKVPVAEASTADIKPSMILSRDLGVGNVLSTAFACDIEVAGHIAAGGVSGPLKIWDAFSNKSVRKAFREPLRALQEKARAEAKNHSRASRISRKYQKEYEETVLEAEGDGDKEDDEDDEDDDEEGIEEGEQDDSDDMEE